MELCRAPLVPYDDTVCDFLGSLSAALLSDGEAKRYPDVISFAFWCRPGNIARLKSEFNETYARLGVGVAFHVTPSNVPINFAFSYAFSLLAGNANIVRVPTKPFVQTAIVSRVIKELLNKDAYRKICDMTMFIRYEQDDAITGALSAQCNARIIWGGDATVRNIRKLPVPERSVEIAFADRYSLAMISVKSILALSDSELKRLAGSFYNDTFLMDQNACSSPQMIIWVSDVEHVQSAQQRFWNAVYQEAATKYDLQPVSAIDKLTKLCENAIDLDSFAGVTRYGNLVYCVALNELTPAIDALRGRCGYFYEHIAADTGVIADIVNTKYQTLTYFGLDRAVLRDLIVSRRLSGIDRVVPIGAALDISVIWDGYDLVRTLSRIIDVR